MERTRKTAVIAAMELSSHARSAPCCARHRYRNGGTLHREAIGVGLFEMCTALINEAFASQRGL